MSIAMKTEGKKLEREINLAQCIEPERRMKWSDTDIAFRLEDHPETKLSNRNLPFVIKLPIGQHMVAKTGRQQGFPQPHSLEDFHRDGPQSSRSNPST
jgi:hypothetical protein